MNPTGKKFISLFLVFSLLMLSVNLYAKERRGAKIEIWVTGDRYIRHIKGELITVRPNSLLLLNTEGKDVSVDIADIEVIRVVKKSKLLLGAGIGIVICVGVALIGISEEARIAGHLGFLLPAGVVAGGLLGALIGAISGKDKAIHFEGMTDSEIQETLDYLRKKARVRDYK